MTAWTSSPISASLRELPQLERELMAASDVRLHRRLQPVRGKKGRHPNVHPFPSSVDRKHFSRARAAVRRPADQGDIKTPRFGFTA
jgi:UDP-galactopyranose mutase